MLVRLHEAEKRYDSFCLQCSLEVREGYVTGLIGPNGAGKSTAFKMILGLIYPDAGEASVLGKPARSLTAFDKEAVGAVLPGTGFSGYLSVRDILPVLKSMYRDFQEEEFVKRCEQFGLPLDKKIKEFSTGMKAKLKVLTAISHKAKLLVLDEPTAGLDVIARDQILDLLREYMMPGDRSILVSSHISSDLEGLCDDFYLIDGGKILLHEETDVLLESYGVLKMTEEQYRTLDREWILKVKKEPYGYSALTGQRQYYMENYPEITMEKGSMDDVIMMMVQGGQA